MKTVKEIKDLTGVSIRTLHYYDEISLLCPTSTSNSGYRLYDDIALERLQHILMFRELEFPLKEIKKILDSSNFDRNKALQQQIELLSLKKERLDHLITFARELKTIGEKNMDFKVFDTKKIDDYTAQAKAAWGETSAYKEFEKKNSGRSSEETKLITKNLMNLFVEFGQIKKLDPASDLAQKQAKKLQDYISKYFYKCSPLIFSSLADMYADGGEMTENINKAGGPGTAEFSAKVIKLYCGEK